MLRQTIEHSGYFTSSLMAHCGQPSSFFNCRKSPYTIGFYTKFICTPAKVTNRNKFVTLSDVVDLNRSKVFPDIDIVSI